ncbi:MAG: glycoside hydrolase family 78 protein [Lachnospiraceae bacterium]|nr:glycoside hydrolase family 78 protein [Lachnospiraceae bacterium]
MRKRKALAVCLLAAVVLSSVGCQSATKDEEVAAIELLEVDAKASVVNLKVDGIENPLGLDDETPSFSWQMASDVIGAAQKSYKITVWDEDENVMWDSGEVESQKSNEITYEGEALAAKSSYTWQVCVTDTSGSSVNSDKATFETGFLSEELSAFQDATFIGASELNVDAKSLCVYDIDTTVTIPEGSSSAALIIGADDYRLENENFNINHQVSDENYVKIELDVSGVEAGTGVVINAYRVGYKAGEDESTPVCSISEDEDFNALITSENLHSPHEFSVCVSANKITIGIDGTFSNTSLCVNDLGDNSSYNTYPNLNSVGFATKEGEAASFENFTIKNGGQYGTKTLFDSTTGATYDIFQGLSGVSVNGTTIDVSGATVAYADPSYGSLPMLRKDFSVEKEVEKARLYVTAEGIYNLYLNGEEVAEEEWFNPGDSSYDSLLGYNTYDVTEFLSEGGNTISSVLAGGWWSGNMTFEASNSNYYGEEPALLASLEITYKDGTSDVIGTDESWTSYVHGPYVAADFLQGETYDASLEADVEGWMTNGFSGEGWENAVLVETRSQFSNMKLTTRTDQPVHVIRTTTAVECLGETNEGTNSYIYDMGENVSGVPLITIPAEVAKAGEKVTLRFAEVLYPETEEYTTAGIDGELMVENYRAALVTDFYTMKEGENIIAPDLTFHGYRYIEISGLDEALDVENVKMQVLSSLDATGTYVSSNELANQLYTNITNSTTSNYISIPTDCPQRNERQGWTGDAQIFALTGSYIADTYNFMDTWMDSVRADSGENGMSAQYAPAFSSYDVTSDDEIEHKGMSFGITWNGVAVTVPYNLYMQTGRTDIIEENKENIYAYMETLFAKPFNYKNANEETVTEERLTGEYGTLADHLARVVTDSPLLGTAVYIELLDDAAVMARAIGDIDQAEIYETKAVEAREAWNEIFIDSETGKTRNAKGEIEDTQASYATALRYDVVSEENLEKTLENYEATIAKASGTDDEGVEILPYTLTTGFNATGNLLPALSKNGLNDTAYQLFESSEYASWLYPVTLGATSVWERWNSLSEETGFNGNNAMNSFNHYSFGAVGDWMMSFQAGITTNEDYPGYESFVLQPTAGGDYTSLEATYDSVYGTIKSSWTAKDGEITTYTCTVPANTTATLYLPTEAKDNVSAEGVCALGEKSHNGIATMAYQLVAGTYTFVIDSEITCK